MKMLQPLTNLPVVAFILVIVAGWALCLIYGEWWWLAGAIPFALIAGDLAEAMFRPPDQEQPPSHRPAERGRPKNHRTTKKGP